MSMSRREFLQVLAAAAASGLVLDSRSVLAGNLPAHYYDTPPATACVRNCCRRWSARPPTGRCSAPARIW